MVAQPVLLGTGELGQEAMISFGHSGQLVSSICTVLWLFSRDYLSLPLLPHGRKWQHSLYYDLPFQAYLFFILYGSVFLALSHSLLISLANDQSRNHSVVQSAVAREAGII